MLRIFEAIVVNRLVGDKTVNYIGQGRIVVAISL